MRILELLLVCCALVGAASLSLSSQAPPALVFDGARLILGDGGTPIDPGVLVVQGDRIVSVGRRGDIAVPPGATRVDVAGKTIMPALVTLHGHLGYVKGLTLAAENYTRENLIDHLHRYAYYGIAAMFTAGTDAGDLPFQLRDNPVPGAALLRLAGRGMAAPNSGPFFVPMRQAAYGVATPEDARRYVSELAARKVDFIKIWVDDRGGTVPKLTPPLYRAIIDEARKHGIGVVAHVFYLADAHDLVDAGVAGFLHLVRDAEMDERLVAKMKARNVFVTPNLAFSDASAQAAKPGWLDDPLLADSVSPDVIKRASDTFLNRTEATLAPARKSYMDQQRSLARLNKAGVTIALGDDAGIPDVYHGYTDQRELELMVNAGMTPAQVIVAATQTPARLLRLDQLGTLERGKSADFIVLDGNPLDNIANTRRISRVYLRGLEVNRAALRSAWKIGTAR